MEFFRCIDLNQKYKPIIFDDIHMIEDTWSKMSVLIIKNRFNHTKIILKLNENEDSTLRTHEFINKILKSQ